MKDDILFVGDALFPGGNDAPVKDMGIDCLESKGPEDTIGIIKEALDSLAVYIFSA
jgi:glyoxylase-like metal-dependent hydrolase (beta-lactamase superfamily II)